MIKKYITQSNKTKNTKLSRRDRKILQTRIKILKSARTLFQEKSFDEVLMEEISEKADISRATLYNYFDKLPVLE